LRDLPSFPTRRSSDLVPESRRGLGRVRPGDQAEMVLAQVVLPGQGLEEAVLFLEVLRLPGGVRGTALQQVGDGLQGRGDAGRGRSEEHTSELQSQSNL